MFSYSIIWKNRSQSNLWCAALDWPMSELVTMRAVVLLTVWTFCDAPLKLICCCQVKHIDYWVPVSEPSLNLCISCEALNCLWRFCAVSLFWLEVSVLLADEIFKYLAFEMIMVPYLFYNDDHSGAQINCVQLHIIPTKQTFVFYQKCSVSYVALLLKNAL